MPTDAQKRALAKWRKNNMKRLSVEVRIDYYDQVLLPATKKVNESVSGFVKQAIAERISRIDAGIEQKEEKLSFAAWLEQEYGIEFSYFDNNFSSSESDRIWNEYYEYLDSNA